MAPKTLRRTSLTAVSCRRQQQDQRQRRSPSERSGLRPPNVEVSFSFLQLNRSSQGRGRTPALSHNFSTVVPFWNLAGNRVSRRLPKRRKSSCSSVTDFRAFALFHPLPSSAMLLSSLLLCLIRSGPLRACSSNPVRNIRFITSGLVRTIPVLAAIGELGVNETAFLNLWP